jgi:peptidoglycan biosynthesis protein MviN/MurJ (putative lipid II flippase)
MLMILWWMRYDLVQWLAWSNSDRIMHLLVTIFLAIGAYFTCLIALGVRKHNFFPTS